MFFTPPAMMFLSGAIYLLFGFLLLYLMKQQQVKSGYREWMVGTFLSALGLFIGSQKALLPEGLHYFLSHIFMISFYILLPIGLEKFAGVPVRRRQTYQIAAFSILGLMFFCSPMLPEPLRHIFSTLLLVYLTFRCAQTSQMAHTRLFGEGGDLLTLSLFSLSTVFALRLGTEALRFIEAHHLIVPFDSASLIAMCVLTVGTILGLLVLNFRLLNQEIEHSSERFRNLFESSRDAIVIIENHRFVDANIAALDLFGCWQASEMIGKNVYDFSAPQQADGKDTRSVTGKHTRDALEHGSAFFEWLHMRLDGTVFNAEVLLSALPSHGEMYLQATVRDITKRKRMEEKLELLASTDSLTEADNRRAFFEKAEKELQQANKHGYDISLLMIDIDHFKRVNDTYGHQAGDKVLRRMADHCKASLRGSDLFGRIGGEEFALLLSDTDSSQAVAIAERLRCNCKEIVVEWNKQRIRFTISIGISTRSDSAAQTMDQLVAEVDEFLYYAKENGRNQVAHAANIPKNKSQAS